MSDWEYRFDAALANLGIPKPDGDGGQTVIEPRNVPLGAVPAAVPPVNTFDAFTTAALEQFARRYRVNVRRQGFQGWYMQSGGRRLSPEAEAQLVAWGFKHIGLAGWWKKS